MALWTRKASLAIGCGHLLLGTLLGCGTMPQNRSWPESRSEQAIVQPSVVQSLQRQVRDRDRRIAELTFQLEAMKTIDRDVESKRQASGLYAPADRNR